MFYILQHVCIFIWLLMKADWRFFFLAKLLHKQSCHTVVFQSVLMLQQPHSIDSSCNTCSHLEQSTSASYSIKCNVSTWTGQFFIFASIKSEIKEHKIFYFKSHSREIGLLNIWGLLIGIQSRICLLNSSRAFLSACPPPPCLPVFSIFSWPSWMVSASEDGVIDPCSGQLEDKQPAVWCAARTALCSGFDELLSC